MEKHVLIDDVRSGRVDLICRTAREGIEALKEGGITHLYLDNDLGVVGGYDGIDILQWARDNDLVPPNVMLVTSNPVARKRMEELLMHDLGYTYRNRTWSKS